MASIIKTLLQTYKTELQEQDAWNQTSKVKVIERDRFRRFGDQLLETIIYLMTDEEQLEQLTPMKLSKLRSLLLNNISLKHKTKQNVVERALGLFIRDCFEKYDQFKKIKEELEIFYEDIDMDPSEIDEDDEMTIGDTVYTSHYPSSIRGHQSVESDFSFIEKWDNEVQTNQDKYKLIMQYLSGLSAPASQLTYLCQHYGWKFAYEKSQRNDGQFENTAVVQFEYKDTRKELRESAIGQNSKIARMFASAKMLKKIYISFPHLWEFFCSVKKTKGIELPSTDVSSSIINTSGIMNHKVEIVKPQTIKEGFSESQTNSYMNQITSFKAEMNLLIQQIPASFSRPQMEKQPWMNQWRVNGCLQYISQKGLKTKYEESEVSHNSKLGQEMVTKKLLRKVYLEHPEVVEIMSMIKRRKGITT